MGHAEPWTEYTVKEETREWKAGKVTLFWESPLAAVCFPDTELQS